MAIKPLKRLFGAFSAIVGVVGLLYAETSTTRLGLKKPAHGEYQETWETPINNNMDTIDTSVAALGLTNTFTGTNNFSGPVTFPSLTASQCLTLDGSKIVTSQACITPPGANTEVMYNQGGNIAASPNFTFNGTTITVKGVAMASATLSQIIWGNGTVQVSSPAVGATGPPGVDGTSFYPATATASFPYGITGTTVTASTVALNAITNRSGTTIIRTDGGNYLTISSITFASDGTVLTSTSGLVSGANVATSATQTFTGGNTFNSWTTHNGSVTLHGNVNVSSGVLLSGSSGVYGQVFTSDGIGNVPVWSTPTVQTLISSGIAFGSSTNTVTQDTMSFTWNGPLSNGLYASSGTISSLTVTGMSAIQRNETTGIYVSQREDASVSTYYGINMDLGNPIVGYVPATSYGAKILNYANGNTYGLYSDARTQNASSGNAYGVVGRSVSGTEGSSIGVLGISDFGGTTLSDGVRGQNSNAGGSNNVGVHAVANGGDYIYYTITVGAVNYALKAEAVEPTTGHSGGASPKNYALWADAANGADANYALWTARGDVHISTLTVSQFVVTNSSDNLASYDLFGGTNVWTGGQTLQSSVVSSSNVYFSTGGIAGFDEYQNGSYVSISTINWQNGNKQMVTLTANTAVAFSTPTYSGNLVLRLARGAGSFAVTWPTAVLWSGGTTPTITVTASKNDICSFYFSLQALKYYGVCSQNF